MATEYNFSAKRGDTRKAITFSDITLNGAPIVIASAIMQVKKKATDAEPVFTPLLSASGDSVEILKQIWNIPARDYVYDIQMTLENGDVKTWISGTITIDQDVSA